MRNLLILPLSITDVLSFAGDVYRPLRSANLLKATIKIVKNLNTLYNKFRNTDTVKLLDQERLMTIQPTPVIKVEKILSKQLYSYLLYEEILSTFFIVM